MKGLLDFLVSKQFGIVLLSGIGVLFLFLAVHICGLEHIPDMGS